MVSYECIIGIYNKVECICNLPTEASSAKARSESHLIPRETPSVIVEAVVVVQSVIETAVHTHRHIRIQPWVKWRRHTNARRTSRVTSCRHYSIHIETITISFYNEITIKKRRDGSTEWLPPGGGGRGGEERKRERSMKKWILWKKIVQVKMTFISTSVSVVLWLVEWDESQVSNRHWHSLQTWRHTNEWLSDNSVCSWM